MTHDPGKDPVLEAMDHPLENEFVEDNQNNDEEKQVAKEGLMCQVEQDAKADCDPEARFFKDSDPG
jgi:hypothetical protein